MVLEPLAAKLWKKGETSGNVLAVEEVRDDCDGDALLLRVRPAGPACHTGSTSCFAPALWRTVVERVRDRPEGSYVASLADAGVARAAQKLGEEAVEAAIAATAGDGRLVAEAADVLFHLYVLLAVAGVDIAEVEDELATPDDDSLVGMAEENSRHRGRRRHPHAAEAAPGNARLRDSVRLGRGHGADRRAQGGARSDHSRPRPARRRRLGRDGASADPGALRDDPDHRRERAARASRNAERVTRSRGARVHREAVRGGDAARRRARCAGRLAREPDCTEREQDRGGDDERSGRDSRRPRGRAAAARGRRSGRRAAPATVEHQRAAAASGATKTTL